MDAKLGHAVTHRLYVAEQTSVKPLDPSDHNATNRGVCQTVEPRGEPRECFDAEHGINVIERLHIVKTACRAGPQGMKGRFPRQPRRCWFRRPEPAGRQHPLLAGSSRPTALGERPVTAGLLTFAMNPATFPSRPRRNGRQVQPLPTVATARSTGGDAAVDDVDHKSTTGKLSRPLPFRSLLGAASSSATHRRVMSPGSARIYRQRGSTHPSPDNPHGCWTLRPGFTVNLQIDLTVNFFRALNATSLPSEIPSD